MKANTAMTRRDFLATTAAAAGGLVIGFFLPGGAKRALAGPPEAGPAALNAFLRIAPDSTVTVLLKHVEMGQGVATSLPMVIAEELDCDWTKVRSEHAPAGQEYAHTAFGMQMTGGSTSTWESFDQLRKAGATARALLVEAAAQKWGVAAADCRTENGLVVSGDRKASYGELAEAAAKLKAPGKVALKEPKDWKLIGKPVKRLDTPAKVTGQAIYGMDVRRPGMAFAAIARPPFGGKLKSFDGTQARTVPGVLDVYRLSNSVAVVAKTTHAARTAVELLKVEWDRGEGASLSTPAMLEEYRKLSRTKGATAAKKGDAEAKLGEGAIEAEYDMPFQAHAPMETLNCTVERHEGSADIWTGTQMPMMDAAAAAKVLGLTPEKVRLHTPYIGGGFGRRANPRSDFVVEACEVAMSWKSPVQVVWSREDDLRGGFYRPMWLSRMRAKLGADGKPVAWAHTLVGQSILVDTPFEAMLVKDGVDGTSVEGAANSPYLTGIPDFNVELHSPKSPVTTLWWRSVGHSHTAFVVESFVDELAAAAKKDPVEYRRSMLAEHPRHLRVLNLAAEKFGWGKPLAAGRAAGVAVHESFGSFVCHIAEVSVDKNQIRVHRVVSAVDCGPVVNPDTVAAQVESGIAYGLTAALKTRITFTDGNVDQVNFREYRLLRFDEMPDVEVHIADSKDPMGGIGEPGTPPIAPAVANAVFALTGKRLRSLPMKLG